MKEKFREFLKHAPIISNIEKLHEVFAEIISHQDGIYFLELLNKKNKGHYKPEFSYRILNHWENKKLISKNREGSGKWRQYSILDQVWLEIVIQLRSFGVDLKNISKIREYSNVFQNETKSDYPILALYQGLSMISGNDPCFLIVKSDGSCQYCLKKDFITDLIYKTLTGLIIIDVSRIFSDVTDNQMPYNRYDRSDLRILRGEDVAIFNEIKNRRNHSIFIKKDDNGLISNIETERIVEANQSAYGVNFGEITTKIADGKAVYKTLKTKKKIR